MSTGFLHNIGQIGGTRLRGHVLTAALVVLGIAFLVLFSFRQFLALAMLAALTIGPVLVIILARYPAAALFTNLLLYFSPITSKTGDYFFFLWVAVTVGYQIVIKRRFRFDKVILLWCCIALLVAITIPRWHSILTGIRGIQYAFLMPLFLYWLITQDIINQHERRMIFTHYLPVLALYICLQVIFLVLAGNAFTDSSWMSTHLGFDLVWSKSNGIAAAAVFFAAILYGIQSVSRAWRTTAIAMNVIFVLLAFIIVSRGAILSLVVGCALYYLLKAIMERSIDLRKYMGYLVAVAITIALIGGSYAGALFQRFREMKIDMSFFARLYMYYDCTRYMLRSPLVGAGPNQYQFKDFFTNLLDPHNMFLRYGVEVGTISIFIIAAILLVPIVRLLRRYNKAIYSFLMLPYLVAILNSQFESAITRYNYGMVFWLIYACMMKLLDEQERNIFRNV